ncbi:response regulator [Vibrio sp. OCN044]|uniref:Response regulator n=1 Tax=Vibrio tetraodonis subsp. pristinus TaxID=2695891 RepID=A0A6L8LW71_9VIBR|nr:response regulator [Vibrio tetraodonis]MYM58920.1 response regulator [Vibrio tetraodonis subsp. pristinus]
MARFEPDKFTILVVEDNNLSRKALIGMLFKSGYENILSAPDGQTAIDKIEHNHVDLVVTDINMPHINGLQLIKAIRTGSTHAVAETSIIAVTSLSDIETISACMRLEVDAFLPKPVTVKDAREQIEQAVTGHTELYQQHLYHEIDTDLDGEKKEDTQQPQPHSIDHTTTLDSLFDLRAGMTLVRDIFAHNGTCLVKAGTQLDGRLVKRLCELKAIIDEQPIRVELETTDA